METEIRPEFVAERLESWRDEFFPPLTLAVILKRCIVAAAVFLAWVVLGTILALAFIKIGFSTRVAIAAGALVPVLVLIVLNIFGLLNRKSDLHVAKDEFLRRVSSPTGEKHGLSVNHIQSAGITEEANLLITVTEEWLLQEAWKKEADTAEWMAIWSFCLLACGCRSASKVEVVRKQE